ncbi:hypothetical protein B5C34_05390 [Pacificimonas flava]|uniref:Uncharacterized protein n=2 Tax=Pacificimonas TaxID=1960290 RepID=A0A219B4B0_9SPHN|nr:MULTISPECIES: hypothetical protein [Pacificimonas]MBZ6377346.1 hypothetical protein [Pacificimonas aurantium]OWV32946.1 hypothetical protein B5C34_05390 [Pacificimonas flava]
MMKVQNTIDRTTAAAQLRMAAAADPERANYYWNRSVAVMKGTGEDGGIGSPMSFDEAELEVDATLAMFSAIKDWLDAKELDRNGGRPDAYVFRGYAESEPRHRFAMRLIEQKARFQSLIADSGNWPSLTEPMSPQYLPALRRFQLMGEPMELSLEQMREIALVLPESERKWRYARVLEFPVMPDFARPNWADHL